MTFWGYFYKPPLCNCQVKFRAKAKGCANQGVGVRGKREWIASIIAAVDECRFRQIQYLACLTRAGKTHSALPSQLNLFNGYRRPLFSRPGWEPIRRPAMKIQTPLAVVNEIHVDEARLFHRQIWPAWLRDNAHARRVERRRRSLAEETVARRRKQSRSGHSAFQNLLSKLTGSG
jgi:hypothetical protein